MSAEELYQAIMALPDDQRWDLMDRVWETAPELEFGVDIDDPNLEKKLDERAADLKGSIEWSQLRDER
jgi:hypothetical protein